MSVGLSSGDHENLNKVPCQSISINRSCDDSLFDWTDPPLSQGPCHWRDWNVLHVIWWPDIYISRRRPKYIGILASSAVTPNHGRLCTRCDNPAGASLRLKSNSLCGSSHRVAALWWACPAARELCPTARLRTRPCRRSSWVSSTTLPRDGYLPRSSREATSKPRRPINPSVSTKSAWSKRSVLGAGNEVLGDKSEFSLQWSYH